jgi:dihydrofolate reductase
MTSGRPGGHKRHATETERTQTMGRIVVSQFITLDGVVEDPGGAEGFERGGWAFRYERGEAGDRFKLDEVMSAGALLLGRRTYEGFAAAWPSRTGDFADKFNTMPKYVVSSTLSDPEWSNSTVISGDVAAGVREAAGRVDGDVLVNGSVQLSRALLEQGLVDEWRLMLYPTVLGAGKKLFGDTPQDASLRLVDSRPAGETLILTYVPRD